MVDNQRDASVTLIEKLSHELALMMEHYEEDPTKWFPESLKSLDEASLYLNQNGVTLPEPVQFVFRRRVDFTTPCNDEG